jgi:hypothetical protein
MQKMIQYIDTQTSFTQKNVSDLIVYNCGTENCDPNYFFGAISRELKDKTNKKCHAHNIVSVAAKSHTLLSTKVMASRIVRKLYHYLANVIRKFYWILDWQSFNKQRLIV